MARLVQIVCPHCGAGMRIDGAASIVTCSFCHLSSFVQREGEAPKPAPPGPSMPTVVVPPSPSAAPVLAIIGAVVLVAVAAFMAIGARSSSSALLADPPDLPTANAQDGQAVRAVDPSRADATEILAQARAIAQSAQPRSELTTVYLPVVRGGLIDTSGELAASMIFEYRYEETGKAPGEDVVYGRVIITVGDGHMRSLQPLESSFGRGGQAMGSPLAEPRCTSKRAFETAVESGVPKASVASLYLYDNTSFSPQSPLVWSFRVEGHDEYRRDIDAQTCALVKSWAPGAKAPPRNTKTTPNEAPKAPAAKGPCGCAAGDLMCAMRCAKTP